MKFIIDVSKWYRGHELGSLLLREDGQMCCVGQMCRQLGVDPAYILGQGSIHTVYKDDLKPLPEDVQDRLKAAYLTNYDYGIDLYSCNDDEALTEQARREQLAELLKISGHEVEFVEPNVSAGLK